VARRRFASRTGGRKRCVFIQNEYAVRTFGRLLVRGRLGAARLFMGTDGGLAMRKGVEDLYHYRSGQSCGWMATAAHGAKGANDALYYTHTATPPSDKRSTISANVNWKFMRDAQQAT